MDNINIKNNESQNLFNVIINTPKGTFLDEMVSIVTFKTTEGYRGVMKDATEFMASIVPSKLYISFDEKLSPKEYYIDHGLVHFKNNLFSIIINEISDKPIEDNKMNTDLSAKKYTVIEEIKIKRNIVKNNSK
ncbi:F0F1 ATP synthase subunit epsilon [Metamycoplasma faucium]|jgi:ATP synthase F1, epsilon subunit|uniref:F0F1 ATP synthase subunit epsilon n=1 Tax=Metamycoplasma faucium TaxID=56142 RepID=A0ABZ2TKN6_9BACT